MAQGQSFKNPCATQKVEVAELEHWVGHDGQSAPLAINQIRLADATLAFPAQHASGTETVEIRLTEDTMEGNEAEASNPLMRLRVRGRYQQMFSGKWYMGIKIKPLRDLTISKITYYSFSGETARLRGSEKTFYPPAGQFERLVEREIDTPYIASASSMILTFYDQKGDVLGSFRITNIR